MVRTLIVLIGLLISGNFSFGQDSSIDPRIILNKGVKESENIFRYNQNYYNYLKFELDSSYQVVAANTLSGDEEKLINKTIKISKEEQAKLGTDQFNFYQLGIRLSSYDETYIELNNDQVLVFKPIIEITKSFSASPFNTK
jgi:hypothetical protein